MQQKISILIPAYQAEPYLRRCLDSALKQSFQNLEIIVVDDGSADGTPAILSEYAAANSCIRVKRVEHLGLSNIRNILLKDSTGDYLFFLDADDFIAEDALESLYQTATHYQAEIVQCEMESTEADALTGSTDDGVVVYTRSEALAAYNRSFAGPRCMSAGKLYKRSVFAEISYPDDGRLHEDEYVAFLLLDRCSTFVALRRKLYGYFRNPNSIMRGKFDMRRMDVLGAVQNSIVFFREHGLPKQVARIQFRYLTLIGNLYRNLIEAYPEKIETLTYLLEEYTKTLPDVLANTPVTEELRSQIIAWGDKPLSVPIYNYWHYVGEETLLP